MKGILSGQRLGWQIYVPTITKIPCNNLHYLFTMCPAPGILGFAKMSQAQTNRGQGSCIQITLQLGGTKGGPGDLEPFEGALEGEAGFGPAETRRTAPPRSGGARERHRGWHVWQSVRTPGSWSWGCVKGKKSGKVRKGGTKDMKKIDLNSLLDEESLRFLRNRSGMV